MDVFVYGTLTDRDRTAAVLGPGGFSDLGPARIYGLRRVGGRYPTLAPGGRVDGRLLRTEHLEALDRYEGVEAGLYARVSVPYAGREGDVETCVGDPDRLEPTEPIGWPGEGQFEERVERCVRRNHLTVERID